MKRCCSNCGWLEVNPSGAMFCGYSDERTWENESCLAWKDKDEPLTNADRIRSMSDEELAKWLWFETGRCPPFDSCPQQHRETPCVVKDCWLDWLKQEVKE